MRLDEKFTSSELLHMTVTTTLEQICHKIMIVLVWTLTAKIKRRITRAVGANLEDHSTMVGMYLMRIVYLSFMIVSTNDQSKNNIYVLLLLQRNVFDLIYFYL